MGTLRQLFSTLRGIVVRHPLRVILVLAALQAVVLLSCEPVHLSIDSFGYRGAIRRVLALRPDLSRTPIYPAFLGVCYALSGHDAMFRLATILQAVAMVWSIVYFKRVIDHLCLPSWLGWLCVCIYAFAPHFTVNMCGIFTEGLAVPGVVMLLYSTCRLRESPGVKTAAVHGLWLALLVFLRPSLLYALPVYAVSWLLLWRTETRRIACGGLAAVATVSLLVLGYMALYREHYGTFTMTSVSTVNQYYMLRHEGLIDTTAIADPSLRAAVAKSIVENGARRHGDEDLISYESIGFIKAYGLPAVQQAVRASWRNHAATAMANYGHRVRYFAGEPVLFAPLPGVEKVYEVLSPPMWGLYVFTIVCMVVVLLWWIARRQLPWWACLFMMLTAGNLIVAILGAQEQWERMTVPMHTIILLQLAQLFMLMRPQSHGGRQLL